jgi:hypothetical protein
LKLSLPEGKLLYVELLGGEKGFGAKVLDKPLPLPGCEKELGIPGDVTKPGAAKAENAPLAANPVLAKFESPPC